MVPSQSQHVASASFFLLLTLVKFPAYFWWYSRKHNAYQLIILRRVEANVVISVLNHGARTFLKPPKPQLHSSFYL